MVLPSNLAPLGTCATDLATAEADLTACQTDLGPCPGDLAACETDLGACEGAPRPAPSSWLEGPQGV